MSIWALAKQLMLPGMLGGVIGAYLLTEIDGAIIKPYVAVYLAVMGLVIIYRAFRALAPRTVVWLAPLALFGGFMDAIGGGGWGPIVTSTLVARNSAPLHRRLGQHDRVLRDHGPVPDVHPGAGVRRAFLRTARLSWAC